jgi:exodeoxyribonuclease VII small subunit
MTKSKQINFETSLKTLEEIADMLESGDMSIEDSLKAFEKGIKLTKECNKKLDDVEGKIEELLSDNNTKEFKDDI